MKTFALLFALVVLSAPAAGADPYDNQLTMAEWNVASQSQRMGVSKMMVGALQPGTTEPLIRMIEIWHCVDAVAIEPRLGHLKLSDVAIQCARKLGWTR